MSTFYSFAASSSTSTKQTTIFSSNQTTENPENRMETETTSMIISTRQTVLKNQTEMGTSFTMSSSTSHNQTGQPTTVKITSIKYSTEKTSNTSLTNQTIMTPMTTTTNLTTMINATDMAQMTPMTNRTDTTTMMIPN